MASAELLTPGPSVHFSLSHPAVQVDGDEVVINSRDGGQLRLSRFEAAELGVALGEATHWLGTLDT